MFNYGKLPTKEEVEAMRRERQQQFILPASRWEQTYRPLFS